MITSTKKDATMSIWAALVVMFLGVLTILLFNFEESYIFMMMTVALITLAHVSYPEPRPKPLIQIIFPNNRFLQWTFYFLYLFLGAHIIWRLWKLLFSG